MHKSNSVGRKDILVVDDVPEIRFLLSDFLTKRGYRTQTAACVDEATGLLGDTDFSLVITNLHLDRMSSRSGCEVLKRAKRLDPKLPVIVISGGVTAEAADQISMLGADALLPKPIVLEQLHLFVRRLLAPHAS